MYIASHKRKENIAEYLLYMWQIEDLIRANNMDMNLIEKNIIEPSRLDPQMTAQLRDWYESLIDMMRREDVTTSGHLQINRNAMGQLATFHNTLLNDPAEADYHKQFYKTLPFIVELRAKAGENKAGEIETCFNFLYGILLMRLQHKEISKETQDAFVEISRLVAMLAAKFHEAENKPDPEV